MKTLVIIDFQYDFFNKKGALYVPGAEEAEEAIVKHIYSDNQISEVVFTLDWHTPKHCSFRNNGGQWPSHCLQYSEGASISQKIMNACIDKKLPIKFFLKGDKEDEEEYGAFGDVNLFFTFKNANNTSFISFEGDEIEVCGLAGDYCVQETIKNLLDGVYYLPISVFLDGIKSIDGGKTFNEFLNDHPEIKQV